MSNSLSVFFSEFYEKSKELFPKYNTNKHDENTKLFPRMVLKTIIDIDLTDEEIEKSLDNLGAMDRGIDAFYIDSDNVLNLFQFKSKKVFENKINNENEIDKFLNALEKIKNETDIKNRKILQLKNILINEDVSDIKYFYCTQNQMSFEEKELIKEIYKDKNLEIFDLEVMYEIYQNNKTKFAKTLDHLRFPIKQILEHKSGDSYVLILDGYQLYLLMEKYKFQLFKNNVRFFLGKTQSVNKEIILTAINQPEKFFNFNNGLTIEASNILQEDNEIFLKEPSFINGAQTINCLYEAFKIMLNSKEVKEKAEMNKIQLKAYLREHFEKINLIAKLTIISDKEEKYSQELTRFVNSQNQFKNTDYLSNLSEQIKLKKYLAQEYNFFYEAKRGETTFLKLSRESTDSASGKLLSSFSKPHLKMESFVRNYVAINSNPSFNYHSAVNLFKIEKSKYKEFCKNLNSEKHNEFEDLVKKMLISQHIVDIVTKEMKYLKDFVKAREINNKENLIRLLNKTNHIRKLDIIECIDDLETYEEQYGKIEIPLMSKGKYIYSFAVYEAILLINTFEKNFSNKIFTQENLMDQNKLSIINKVFYLVTEIIGQMFTDLLDKRTENKITMTLTNNEIENLRKILKNGLIQKNRDKSLMPLLFN